MTDKLNPQALAEHLDHIVSQDLLELFDMSVCVDSAALLRTIPALEAEIEALKAELNLNQKEQVK